MLSASPRSSCPAGRLRSAVITFPSLHRLPAPWGTHLHRYLYILLNYYLVTIRRISDPVKAKTAGLLQYPGINFARFMHLSGSCGIMALNLLILRTGGVFMTHDQNSPDPHREHTCISSEDAPILMKEIRRLHQKSNLLLALNVLLLILVIGGFLYIRHVLNDYAARIDSAFDTIKEMDAMVENLKALYASNEDKINSALSTLDKLQETIETLSGLLNALPFIGG